LAPPDFWLLSFRAYEGGTGGTIVPGPEDLTGIQKFVSEIQSSELELVFQRWTELVQWILYNDGDYFHE
jgi:hypothetical protein